MDNKFDDAIAIVTGLAWLVFLLIVACVPVYIIGHFIVKYW